MTSPMTLTTIIFAVAMILLILNKFRADLIALMVMLSLGLSGVVNSEKVFSGFSSAAVMTILGISIISIGLQQTGGTNAISRILYKLGKGSESVLIFLVTITSAALSLFMNNIAAVGVLLPAVMTLSRRSRVSTSKLLMPLAFGTILGGMATLLTTSNIIVSDALKESGSQGFGLLDYLPVGGLVVVAGIAYLSTYGKKILSSLNKGEQDQDQINFTEKLMDLYQIKGNLSRITLNDQSSFMNTSIIKGRWQEKFGLNILAVLRNQSSIFAPDPQTVLYTNDVLIVLGEIPPGFSDSYHLKVEPVSELQNQVSDESRPLAEILVAPHSRLIGKTIQEIRFRDRYSVNIMGVWRGGKPLHSNYPALDLQFGDALLVQGPASKIRNFQQNQDFVLLEEDPDAVLFPRMGLIALLITLVTLTIAALGVLPVAQVVLAGSVLLILTGSLNINDAFHAIEWKAIFLIAGLWPLSIALQETGLATFLISKFLSFTGTIPPIVIGIIFIFLSMLLTLVMSGQVSAIVMIPLALAASKSLGISPQPLAMAVAMGCSLAFISPLGHPVNIMVMNPGGYSFKDYFRVGLPLTVVAFVVIVFSIHWFWGL